MSTPLEQFEIVLLFILSNLYITNIYIYIPLVFLLIIFLNKMGFFVLKLFSINYLNYILESAYMFVLNMVKQQSGSFGQMYFPYFFILFYFILFSNLLGLTPYGFTITGQVIVTFFFALTFNVSFLLFGLFHHGSKFFLLFVPKEAPIFLIPLLIVIELLSYSLRTLSLSIRLFANMMAGHTLMFILSSFILSFLNFEIFGLLPGGLTFILLFFVFLLEVGIAFLQAYVFVILLSIYLRDSIQPSH